MSIIKQITKALGAEMSKPRSLGNPVPGVFRGIRSGFGYDSSMRSFGLGSGSDELGNIQRKKGKAKTQVGGDDKEIAKGVASAISNGDIILSDSRNFNVNKPVNRSVINIYNPRRVDIKNQGESLDKTTESERREQELEAARRMNERRRGEAAQAKAALLGLGASSALGDTDGDGGGGDSLLEDATDVAATLGARSVVGRAGRYVRGGFSRLRRAFTRMGRRFRVFGGRALQSFARSGVGQFLRNPRAGIQSLTSFLRNAASRATTSGRSVVAKTASIGGRVLESGRALARSNKVRGALKGVVGLSRGAGLAVRALATDPLLLPLWLASWGIDEGLEMADETQGLYNDIQKELGQGVEERFSDRLQILDEFGGSPPSDYHASMAEEVARIQSGIYSRIGEINEKMKSTTDENMLKKLREEKSQLMKMDREGEGIPAILRYAYPEEGGNRRKISGSYAQVIAEHEKLAEEKAGAPPMESSEGLRERIRQNASGLVGSASFGSDSGMGSMFDIIGGLKYAAGQLGFGSSTPSVSPPPQRTQPSQPSVIPVPVPAVGGESPQIVIDSAAKTRSEESKNLRDNTIGSGTVRGTPGLD